MIPGFRDLPYLERMQRLNLPSLEYRRLRGDMIQVFKIVHGIDRLDHEVFFELANTSTRGHSLKLTKHWCKSNVRKDYFSHRIVDDWNSLTEDIVKAPSVDSFKARLDRFWENKRFMSAYSN